MPDLIPAKDGIVDRHPVAEQSEKALDSPRIVVRGRVLKPGMTIQQYVMFCLLQYSLEGGNPDDFKLDSRFSASNRVTIIL
jgi:hypothetical protein